MAFLSVPCPNAVDYCRLLKHNVSINRLPVSERVAILRALTEGCSLRSISRMVGVSINTVTKLLVDAGKACARYQHENLRNLNCQRLELDEIWAFVYAKEKNVPEGMKNDAGSIWTWVAIDAESKLIPSWLVGLRDAEHACAFVKDLAERLAGRVQITTDGLKAYVGAIASGFSREVDYAILHKIYGPGLTTEGSRYSPATCIGCETQPVMGNPNPDTIGTSYIERQNLTMRMRMRRFTRLTNAFSKKIENHEHAIALHFFVYNFITLHKSLRATPAMKAGVANHKWSYEELVEMIDQSEGSTTVRKSIDRTSVDNMPFSN